MLLGMCLYNCLYSGWANSYDRDLDYTVPPGHVMRGITSIHDNGHELVVYLLDFVLCKMKMIMKSKSYGYMHILFSCSGTGFSILMSV
jgi:hypothetical protein